MLTIAAAVLATLPNKLFMAVAWLCSKIYYILSIPCSFMWRTCGKPIHDAMCLPGGCIFCMKESCVSCQDRCCGCCCRRRIDGDDYGSGPIFIA